MSQNNLAQIDLQTKIPQQGNSSHHSDEDLRRSPENQALVERIGKTETYLILDRDMELFDWLDDKRDLKLCGYVVAAHGSGILKACQFYRMQYVKRRGALFEIPATVMYVEISPPASAMDLYHKILEEFGHPLSYVGRLKDLRSRAWGTLKGYGVKLLILGNAHYLKLEAFNELIDLFATLRISVVLAGTQYLHSILGRNSLPYVRVHDSFLEFHEFPNLTLNDLTEVIKDWENKFLAENQRLDLATIPGMIQVLNSKSEGLIESLYDLLRQIAVFKIDEPYFELTPSNIIARLSRRKQPRVKL